MVVEVDDEDVIRRGDGAAEDPILAFPTTGALALLPDDDAMEEDARTGARALVLLPLPAAVEPLFIGTVFPPFPFALTATGS